ncbi:MAG TPA: hypothetical protein EYQ18_27005 [Candidatus Handelsmanbacteria bacterium]|nr:hypothetical protein [Candidatus Handelsmanbacteria bacterium]
MEARIFPIFPQSTSLFAKVLILAFAITTLFFVLLSLAIYAVIEIDGEVGRIAAPVALGSSWAMMLFIFFSVFIWYYLSGRRTNFALIETHLLIRNSAHGQNFTYDQLKADEARIIDLRTEPEYQPGKKIFAIKAFFFYGGAYFLKNGEKAHVFYTGMPKVVYIPMHSEHALLLGPEDPEGFLQALRESASS